MEEELQTPRLTCIVILLSLFELRTPNSKTPPCSPSLTGTKWMAEMPNSCAMAVRANLLPSMIVPPEET